MSVDELKRDLVSAHALIETLREDLRAETDAKMIYAGEVARLQGEIVRIRLELSMLLGTVTT